jgi:hypothetical protein
MAVSFESTGDYRVAFIGVPAALMDELANKTDSMGNHWEKTSNSVLGLTLKASAPSTFLALYNWLGLFINV